MKKLYSIWTLAAVVAIVLIGIAGSYFLGDSNAARNTGSTIAVNSIEFTPSSDKLNPGEQFTVSVVANSGTEPVNSVQAKILYDSSRLQLQNIEETGVFDQTAATDSDTPGIVQVARGKSQIGLSGIIPVINLQFVVKQGATGAANLSFDTSSTLLVSFASNSNILTNTGTANYTIRGK